jgi:hypothetical protein
MKRSEYNEKTKTHTYVIIADDDVAAYIEQNNISDTNSYMIQLLQEEIQRQKGVGQKA